MELSRKDYLLEQFRQGVLLTEIHNPTANAMPARAMDTIPQSAGRRFNASSMLVNTTHASTPAPLTKQPESPAPTQYSRVPITRDPTEPILQPARLSLTSTKHQRTPIQPPKLRPPPPPIHLPNIKPLSTSTNNKKTPTGAGIFIQANWGRRNRIPKFQPIPWCGC